MTSYHLLGRDVEEVYADRVDRALAKVDNPLYMPDFIRARSSVNFGHRLWEMWWAVPSIRATGRTAQGTPVVLYAHVPNFYSDAENVRAAIDDGRLVNGAGPLLPEEFTRLLSLEGNGVFVVDYDVSRKFVSQFIETDSALEHPQTLPLLGVSQEEAEAYLKKYKLAYERPYGNRIGVLHGDDLGSEPIARVLFIGDRGLLSGTGSLNYGARILGVRRAASTLQERV